MNYHVYNQSGAGTPSLPIGLLATSIPRPRWENYRQPRLNGDTRRRKRRLREKLDKLDAIRFAPQIRAVSETMRRRVVAALESELFANAPHQARAIASRPECSCSASGYDPECKWEGHHHA